MPNFWIYKAGTDNCGIIFNEQLLDQTKNELTERKLTLMNELASKVWMNERIS